MRNVTVHRCHVNVPVCAANFSFPLFIDPPKNMYLVLIEGTNVNVSCRAQGRPDPAMQWYTRQSQSEVIISTDPGNRVHFLMDGTLVLSPVLVSDTAVYLCTAENLVGRNDWEIIIIVDEGKNVFVIFWMILLMLFSMGM